MTQYNTPHFNKMMYEHHLALYQDRRFTKYSGMHNLKNCNMYAKRLFAAELLTKQDHKDNLLPRVNFEWLFQDESKFGSIAGDGEE